MIKIEKLEYKKAYVELYEIIKVLSKEEQEKIPKTVLKNLKDNMDKEYKFTLDNQKDILEQNYKVETKALFVELYERYLAPKEEKSFWNKYDRICNNIITEEKQKKYNTDNLFKKHNIQNNIQQKQETTTKEVAIVEYKESLIKRIINKIKSIVHIIEK